MQHHEDIDPIHWVQCSVHLAVIEAEEDVREAKAVLATHKEQRDLRVDEDRYLAPQQDLEHAQ